MAAYALQDKGHDTSEANVLLGHPVDSRDYGLAAQILQAMGVLKIRLLTNNPDKIAALEADGIDVERSSAWVAANARADGYLMHKRAVMAHLD